MSHEYHAQNIPFRGIVDHGINGQPDKGYEIKPEYDPDLAYSGDVDQAEPVEPLYEPINVRIVNEDDKARKEYKLFRVITAYVVGVGSGPSALILPYNDTRVSVFLSNTGSSTVYVSNNSDVSPDNGYPVASGSTLELRSYSEVWAIGESAITEPYRVYLLEQFVTVER